MPIPNVESFSVFLFWIRFWSLNFSCHKSKALTFSTIRCKLLNLKNQKRVLPKLDLPVKPAKKAKAEKPEAEIANADAIMDDDGGDPAPKASFLLNIFPSLKSVKLPFMLDSLPRLMI